MKKRSKIILGISIPIILLTGGMMMTPKTPFDIFLTKDFTKPTKEQQIDYLKKHEEEMTDIIKKNHPKIESIQWDWESLDVGTIGNGLPQGGGTMLTIDGKFNGIKDSSFTIGFNLKSDKDYPSMNDMTLMQPLRVDGGSKLYE